MPISDSFIEAHLNLQVELSYSDHHDFILRHGLEECKRVLDVGTGNGEFVARLAKDHPSISFQGIDKRKQYLETAAQFRRENLEFHHFDMFSKKNDFDLSGFDGFLMRYFLLHVDHAHKILSLLKNASSGPRKIWVIDLDWSKFLCEPSHPSFDLLTKLVKSFCSKISLDSLGGQRVIPLLREAGLKNILYENIPFSNKTMPIEKLAQYLKQEIQCYSYMSGRDENDFETNEIISFIDEELKSGKYKISYGMILVTADL